MASPQTTPPPAAPISEWTGNTGVDDDDDWGDFTSPTDVGFAMSPSSSHPIPFSSHSENDRAFSLSPEDAFTETLQADLRAGRQSSRLSEAEWGTSMDEEDVEGEGGDDHFAMALRNDIHATSNLHLNLDHQGDGHYAILDNYQHETSSPPPTYPTDETAGTPTQRASRPYHDVWDGMDDDEDDMGGSGTPFSIKSPFLAEDGMGEESILSQIRASGLQVRQEGEERREREEREREAERVAAEAQMAEELRIAEEEAAKHAATILAEEARINPRFNGNGWDTVSGDSDTSTSRGDIRRRTVMHVPVGPGTLEGVDLLSQSGDDADADLVPSFDTEGVFTDDQKIAYVGLVYLTLSQAYTEGRTKVQKEDTAWASAMNFSRKTLKKLYAHMQISKAEQNMIEQLNAHGVLPSDMASSLIEQGLAVQSALETQRKAQEEQEEKEKQKVADSEKAEGEEGVENGEGNDEGNEEVNEEEKKEGDDTEKAQDALGDGERSDDGSETSSHMGLTDDEVEGGEYLGYTLSPGVPGPDDPLETFPELISQSAPASPSHEASSSSDPTSRKSGFDFPQAPPLLPSMSESAIGKPRNKRLEELRPENIPLPPSPLMNDPELAHEKGEKEDEEGKDEDAPPPSPVFLDPPTVQEQSLRIRLDIRWTTVADLFLILIADAQYDARGRVLLHCIAKHLGLPWWDVVGMEMRIAEHLRMSEEVAETMRAEEKVSEKRNREGRGARWAMMGLATVGGGLMLGLSAGLLAPAIGAGLAAGFTGIGVAGTGAFMGGAGGMALITTGGVLTGSGLAGKKMHKRTKGISFFDFHAITDDKRANVLLCVSGMLTRNEDFWLPWSTVDPLVGDQFCVMWEPQMLRELNDVIKILAGELLGQAVQTVLGHTMLSALMAGLMWPLAITKLGYIVDNPWSVGLDRARKAGLILADTLLQHAQGHRPVSLCGYSLGARLIFYCLLELARVRAYGIVEDVYFAGAPVTASPEQWADALSVVGGRLVNCYHKNDWVLGFLYRTVARNPVAGLTAIEGIDRLENVDVSLELKGHTGYRSAMPRLLKIIGVPITLEEFAEPETTEERSEREAREDEEAEQRMRLRRESMVKERELRRVMEDLNAEGCSVKEIGADGISIPVRASELSGSQPDTPTRSPRSSMDGRPKK